MHVHYVPLVAESNHIIFSLLLFDLQNCPRIGDILEFVSFDFKGSMNKHARTVFKLEKCTVSGYRVPFCNFHIWLTLDD